MPGKARLDAPGTLHHVMARGIERRKVFQAEADYADFLRGLEAAVASTGVVVFAWAPLPNPFPCCFGPAKFHFPEHQGETDLSADGSHATSRFIPRGDQRSCATRSPTGH